MQVPIGNIPSELVRELRRRKWLSFLIFMTVSFVVLGVGLLWPQKYTSSLTIFVDDQNIIRPLMEGSAVTTGISDRINEAEEMFFSRRVLGALADESNIWGEDKSQDIKFKENLVETLRYKVNFRKKGDNYFTISYSGSDPVKVFRITQKLGQSFISESDSKKKEESRSAYSFIDKQVKSYQAQLKASEENLKDFLSKNVEGTEESVNARLSNLITQIEQANLEKKELLTQQKSLISQLSKVSRTVDQQERSNPYKQRIIALQEQLDVLRLSYHDSYPDIVSVKKQIQDLQVALDDEIKAEKPASSSNKMSTINPFHQELQSEKAKTETKIKTIETRISSLEALLIAANKRMERVQENRANLSELSRDNDVNKTIYEDLLKRREKARVSMHLDIEGQGLSYKIHEPAEFALKPQGIQFIHFAALGLILGFLAPIGLFIAYLQVDPRIRVGKVLQENTGITVLTTIPHVGTPIEYRKNRIKTLLIGVLAFLVVCGYMSIAWLKYAGEISI